MADLQRYKAQQPITPDIHTHDAMREVASSAAQLENAFQNFSNKNMQMYQQQQAYDAKQAGEQAGSDLNFQPSKPITQADMIYQGAALEANKAAVQLDISGNLQRIRDDVLDPKNFGPDALDRYNKLASAYQEGAFASIPKEVQPAAKHFFEYYNQQSQNMVTNHVQGLTRNQMQFQLFDYLHETEKQAGNAAFSGDYDSASALTGQGIQKLQSAVATGLIAGPTAAHLKQGYVSQAHQDLYLGQFSRLLNSDPAKASGFIGDFLQNDNVDMNPIEKMKMVTQMHRMWKQYELQQDADGINLEQQMKSAVAGVQNGESPSQYANVVAQVQGFKPVKYPAFNAKMQAAELSYGLEQALTYTKPEEAQQFLRDHEPNKFLKDGTPNPAYAEMMSVWHHGQDIVNKLDKQWKDDPAGMAIKNPTVLKAYDARNQAATGPDGKVQSVTRGTINPIDAMVNVQRQHGIPDSQLSVMTKSIASSKVAMINGLDLPQGVDALQDIFNQYGPQYAAIVSRDLSKAGLSITPLLALAVKNNPQSRGALPDVLKAMQANPKDLDKSLPVGMGMKDVRKAVPGALSDWEASMQNYNGDTTQHRAQMQGAVGQYAAYLLASGKAKDSAAAAQSAADTLINNFYSYPKINGYKAAIPKQYDTALVNKAFGHLWDEAKSADLQTPQLYASTFHTLGGDALQRQYKSDSISQAHLAVEPGDKSAVLVDNQGSPITTKDGKTFKVNFDDLNDTFSDIRTNIDKRDMAKAQRTLNQFAPNLSAKDVVGDGQ